MEQSTLPRPSGKDFTETFGMFHVFEKIIMNTVYTSLYLIFIKLFIISLSKYHKLVHNLCIGAKIYCPAI